MKNNFLLLINQLDKKRITRGYIQGKQYLIKLATLIVPGILEGSQGPILYTPEENRLSMVDWNGLPLIRNHPFVDGLEVSARHPEILDQQGLGFLFNCNCLDNGTLVGECWFDVIATQLVDMEIFNNLLSNKPLEVSTGLSATLKDEIGTLNGKQYLKIATSYKPDHLAILTDEIGACSISDGCGIKS